jgi:hypothetical protein
MFVEDFWEGIIDGFFYDLEELFEVGSGNQPELAAELTVHMHIFMQEWAIPNILQKDADPSCIQEIVIEDQVARDNSVHKVPSLPLETHNKDLIHLTTILKPGLTNILAL